MGVAQEKPGVETRIIRVIEAYRREDEWSGDEPVTLASCIDDLVEDSLDWIELVNLLEKEFHADLDADLDDYHGERRTVQDLIEPIMRLMH